MFDNFSIPNLEDLKKGLREIVSTSIKTVVEVFKGTLTKQALVEAVKKEFAADNNLKEGIVLGDLSKCDPKMSAIISKDFIEIRTKDFVVNYLLMANSKGSISMITAIICDSVEPSLQEMLNKNQQIVRIQR